MTGEGGADWRFSRKGQGSKRGAEWEPSSTVSFPPPTPQAPPEIAKATARSLAAWNRVGVQNPRRENGSVPPDAVEISGRRGRPAGTAEALGRLPAQRRSAPWS